MECSGFFPPFSAWTMCHCAQTDFMSYISGVAFSFKGKTKTEEVSGHEWHGEEELESLS